MNEHFFTCPHCWEEISMLIDLSVPYQKYVEDCEVCCNPLEISVSCEEGEIVHFEVNEL
ncbi:CPXCG motif-containing cysteine-rich protein [Moheibacter stercoris]|uniref:Transcription elongation factor Elf1 n=1 Tax=Moheibacter stercoris TaxID=1628251 RepID=A0ABV2LQW0_9FLAO